MMRLLPLLAALSLAACSRENAPGAPPTTVAALTPGTYLGTGRDALCIAGEAGGQRAGVIVYGAHQANCSVAGRLAPGGTGWTLTPTGDSECRIALSAVGDTLALGEAPAACAYYCGPDVSLSAKRFRRASGTARVTDLAGDALC